MFVYVLSVCNWQQCLQSAGLAMGSIGILLVVCLTIDDLGADLLASMDEQRHLLR